MVVKLDIPLLVRFPALAILPRVKLCELPSPVERLEIPGAHDFWVKRDDLNAPACGGNKVRALEFLLGGVGSGDTVLTLGGAGSTHVLCTAIQAERIGARVAAVRWKHDMNPVADSVNASISRRIPDARVGRSTLLAFGRAAIMRRRLRAHFIPLGGSTPLGTLGHVNAAMEFAEQVHRRKVPLPDEIFVPLGSGGTTAGLALGFAIAELNVRVVGVRVGPRMFVGRRKVMRIAQQTATMIRSMTGEPVPLPDRDAIGVEHRYYGGAYGRPLLEGVEAARAIERAAGIRLDATYSAKAFAAALAKARERRRRMPTLFWLTFDARCLTS